MNAETMAEDDFKDFQPIRQGTITRWDDAKGCGWVESGRERLFLHIKEFERGQRRPRVGEEIRYFTGTDAKGRSCATGAKFMKSGGRMSCWLWAQLVGLLVLPLLAVLWLPMPLWVVPGTMLLLSLITYGMYAHDKQQAIDGAWRVPENSLHLAELLGGWPGAWVAQKCLRHKTSKTGYQIVFWCIVILFQFAAADVISGHQLSRWLLEQVDAIVKSGGPGLRGSSPRTPTTI